MSVEGTSRAGELAARQVESIVTAAEAAAEEVKREAERKAEEIRRGARKDAERELEQRRTEAVQLGKDARRDAKGLVEEAEKESAQIREQTRRATEGRVAEAEKRAAQVMSEAETLSDGLRRLGESLTGQGERILRDVQAAHRRMQADLRIGPSDSDIESEPASERTRTRAASPPAGERGRPAGRRNPLEDLEVPRWVGRSSP
jgi:hypothetical protein